MNTATRPILSAGERHRPIFLTGMAFLALFAVMATASAFLLGGSARASDGPAVQIATAGDAGEILTGSNGMTLYTFDRDEPGKSNCSGGCAGAWPPLLIEEGHDDALTGASGTFSIITRADGGRQVAYNDRPLYFYAGDTQPGDTTGEGVGGVWYIARP